MLNIAFHYIFYIWFEQAKNLYTTEVRKNTKSKTLYKVTVCAMKKN